MREINYIKDFPEYFFHSQPTRSRLAMDYSKRLKKPGEASKILQLNGSTIYVQKEGTDGKRIEHYEEALINIFPPNKTSILEVEEDIITKKKKNLLRTDEYRFHYVQKRAIENYYRASIGSPLNKVLEKLTIEITETASKSLESDISSVMKLAMSQDRMKNIIAEIEFKNSDEYQKFIQVHRNKINNGDVVLDLELKGRVSDELVQFDNSVALLQRHDVTLDSDEINTKRQELGKKMVNNIFSRLKNNSKSKSVIVSGKFNIEEENKNYHLCLLHPISDLITQMKLEIKVVTPKEGIDPDWAHIYYSGGDVIANVFGSVYSWTEGEEDGKWEILINPVAIYAE
jgi:hypothetical protein